MQKTSLQTVLDRDALKAFSGRHDEPSWLAAEREAALDAFLAAPMPDRALHLWRYSDPGLFEPESFELAISDGKLGVRLGLGEEARGKGVVALPLWEAAADSEHGARVRQYLAKIVGKEFGRLEALDLAAWTRGVYLHVPRGVRLKEALHVDFSAAPAGLFDGRRVLAVIEGDAELTLVERHSRGMDGGTSQGGSKSQGASRSKHATQGTSGSKSQGASRSKHATQGTSGSKSHGVSEVFVGPGASVNYVLLQTLDATVNAHLTQRVVLERDARARVSLLSFGGRAVKIDTGTLLRGEGSEVETVGLLYGRGRQFFDHHTDHHHSAAHTNSNLDFKVVLNGRSHSAYTGNITIEKKAPFSSAFQENRNLLLSEKAHADSIPELEIDIDEVQCSHGATIGQVNPDELFYLMSRGITEKEAVRQIVRGFLEAILEKIPEELQDPMRNELDLRIEEI